MAPAVMAMALAAAGVVANGGTLAAVMAGACCLAVECDETRIDFRIRTRYLDAKAQTLDEALALIASTEEVADAKVFNNDGEQLAHWQRNDSGMLAHLETLVATTLLDEPVNLPIHHQQQKVGHIELIGQGRSLLLFLLGGLGGILLCMVLSAVIALYLSQRLLGDIVRPLRGLRLSMTTYSRSLSVFSVAA